MATLNLLPMTDGKAETYSLKITDRSDNSFLFDVDDSLEMEISNDFMSVKSTQNGNELHLHDIKGISYEVRPFSTGMASPNLILPNICFNSDSISFVVDSDEEETYSIYTCSGILMAQSIFKKESSIDLSSFSSGTYILKIGCLPS
ncbi:MAG: T9SS type A sorting domain-containing protein, partial [Muribaculaceae bacterium]|nr:T9SS type A sorting domain-containing protein [Muribaculaceae bacterium]